MNNVIITTIDLDYDPNGEMARQIDENPFLSNPNEKVEDLDVFIELLRQSGIFSPIAADWFRHQYRVDGITVAKVEEHLLIGLFVLLDDDKKQIVDVVPVETFDKSGMTLAAFHNLLMVSYVRRTLKNNLTQRPKAKKFHLVQP